MLENLLVCYLIANLKISLAIAFYFVSVSRGKLHLLMPIFGNRCREESFKKKYFHAPVQNGDLLADQGANLAGMEGYIRHKVNISDA